MSLLLDELRERLSRNKEMKGGGVYSVCSAHKTVIEAAMLQAKADNGFALIEATSNQVDQFGGYTGMNPAQFASYVRSIAASVDFPEDRVLLGGDHLGPNTWQKENARKAMENACGLVKAYVEAGFRKIHLDASMFCADDRGDRKLPLADAVTAERVTELCGVCEEAAAALGAHEKPLYIIGTEVPIPGGAREEEAPRPTSRQSVLATLDVHKKAFAGSGLEDAWQRVIAIVAQPGVEFSDRRIYYYDRLKARELRGALDGVNLVFEAHSTDYQRASGLRELAEDHFCILKVGPWLTFRCREALFSLARIEGELIHNENDRSGLETILERVMIESKPNYWENYYHGSEEERYFSRRYSLSDRSRYYWTNRELSASVDRLFANLSHREIPYSLVSQYMPNLAGAVNEGSLPAKPRDLTIAHIREVLGLYARAARFPQTERS
jgi:D-tagatose-1,6-bisphosphate aldolase subunit GatZ/KbaZ